MAETINSRIVLRNDLAAKFTEVNPILMKGEVGVEIDTNKFKFGDGTKNWNDLDYVGVGQTELNNAIDSWVTENMYGEDGKIKSELLPEQESGSVYQVTKDSLSQSDADAISAYLQGQSITPKKNDVIVVSTVVSSVNYEMTGYIYNGTDWVALNGYVDADKVILREDITLAGNYTQVGNLTKSSTGTATFATKGKSVSDAFKEIFSKKLQPTITAQPSVSGFALTGAGAVEAGTSVANAQFGTAKLSAGSYTYGPATGVVAQSYKVDRVAVPSSLSLEDVAAAASGTDDNSGNGFIIGDQGGDNVVSSLQYKVTVSHNEGVVANDNLGGVSDPEIKIAAGEKTQSTTAYTPYRNYFYGATTAKPALDSAYVRSLTKSNKAYAASTITVNVPAGATRVAIACIAGKTGVTKVINETALNADVTATFTKSQVNVEGANGYAAVEYNVWVFEPALPYENAAVLKVTLG